jgi:pimeloyl-ACP methyl ester carboxylesterase
MQVMPIFMKQSKKYDKGILLLHGFPASSHMFRNLMPALADQFHLVAPDYPGFGNSSMLRSTIINTASRASPGSSISSSGKPA